MIRILLNMDWREARKEFGVLCIAAGAGYGLWLIVWGFGQ